MTQALAPDAVPQQTSSFRPISCYVLKIASRCNLNCTYCHMYNLADKSYLSQPAVMSREVVDATITRIQQHSLQHGLKSVSIIFHGGEPLLAGEDFFRYFVESANSKLRPQVTPRFSMQTNATLLSLQWLELFAKLDVHFGISLDGTPEINDANRIDHQGKGSYEKITAAIKLIQSNDRYFKLIGHALAVINLDADPLKEYRHFRGLGLKGVEFHFPDATYDNLPPGLSAADGGTPYADWLIPIFDEWFDTADASFKIRLFENIISLIFGAERSTDSIGGRKSSIVVIETNGGIEPVPALKACGEEFTKVGLNVMQHEIDEAYNIPLFGFALGGSDVLCEKCKRCPIVDVCGGGYLAHRYSSANGFDNPSIYCRDLIKLITHIRERTLSAIPEETRKEMQLLTLSELRDLQPEFSEWPTRAMTGN